MGEHHQIEQPSKTKLDKKYRVAIYDISDNDKELMNEVFDGLCLVAEIGERMCETVLNENIMSIAAMLSSGSKTKHAVKLAAFVDRMNRDEADERNEAFEDMLSGLLDNTDRGIQ